MSPLTRKIVHGLSRTSALLFHFPGPSFRCPLCGFVGPFTTVHGMTGPRPFGRCPKCGALERHRLQRIVLDRLGIAVSARCLQFAPDPITPMLRSRCAKVVTADIAPEGDSIRLDLTKIDMPDRSFDVVYASHVLEHIPDDMEAVREVHRVLRPGGIAVLPVPIVAEKTVEYPEPCPREHGHVRAPGLDYFERYRKFFGRMEIFTSADASDKCQPWIFEDRSHFPAPTAPYRPPMAGFRHIDAVPVCYKTN